MTATAGREVACDFRAGAGRAEIRYPDGVWPLDGFTGVHDALMARVVVLETPQRLVWAVLDQTSLAPEPLERVREVLAGAAEVGNDRVVVSVSHTFSAPHLADLAGGLDAGLAVRMGLARSAVFAAVADAAREAVDALRPATVGAGAGTCDVNVNRDVETAAGWTLGVNEDGFSDKTLTVVRLDDLDAGPVALLVNYAVQPSVLNESVTADGSRLVTADLAGAAMRLVEARTGAVACFLIGAAGDQAPALAAVRGSAGTRLDAGGDGSPVAELLGERLGAAALRVAEAITTAQPSPSRLETGAVRVPGQRATAREEIRPTRDHEYGAEAERDLPYWVLTLGETAIVGTQVELSASTGRRIREASPFPRTLVATMVNGAAKYLPEAAAFDRFTYEAQSSRYAQGSAELLAAQVHSALERLHSVPPTPSLNQGDPT